MDYPKKASVLLALGALGVGLGLGKITSSYNQPLIIEQPVAAIEEEPVKRKYAYWEQFKVLADVIAEGEGGFDSVNRGYPGDTPGGIRSVTRKSFKELSLGEVIELQQDGLIFAVGKFQWIPRTFRFVVKKSGLSLDTLMTDDVQYKLFATTLEYKRPVVYGYLTGEHPHLELALDELAKEWAGIEYANGRGYYDGYNGNKASISRGVVRVVMKAVRYPNVEGK